MQYLIDGPRSAVAGVFEEKINDQDRRVLNLSHDWLMRLLPFVLGKINRVSFGLLSAEQRTRAMTANREMPMSRQLLALPFVGKDLPSDASEFAHPDVVIGLTILAYRYVPRTPLFQRHRLRTHRHGSSVIIRRSSIGGELSGQVPTRVAVCGSKGPRWSFLSPR
jgi:hypothetical protein